MHTELARPTGGTLAQFSAVAEEYAKAFVWSDYMQSKSANTLRAQRGDLESFVSFLGIGHTSGIPTVEQLMTGSKPWSDISGGTLVTFREWLMKQGYAVGTVNRRLATVKVFAKMAGIDVSSAKGFGHKAGRNRDEKRAEAGEQTRKGAKKAYKAVTLTTEQAKKLKARPDSPQGRRDALLMALLLDHGLRCGEVALLKVEDFDMGVGVMTFYRPKVDKVQRHKLTPATLEALKAYTQDMPASGPLLRSSRKGNGGLTHDGMTERSITARVRDLGAEIGIANLSAHDCRHYWATRATEAGTHPRRLQQAGGWNSPAMVMRYVNEAEIANEGVVL